MIQNKNQDKIIIKIRNHVPPKIGVYIFYNSLNKVIYIGKSVNLRKRMLSHFQNNHHESRMEQMVFNIRDFKYYEAKTDLLALLIEDVLIKEYQPDFNIRQQEYLQYQYLILTRDPYPALKIVDRSIDFSNNLAFGPFRDHFFTEKILTIIHRYFNLRSCHEIKPMKKCINNEIGLCKGVCIEKISKKEYSQIVKLVVNFLNGDFDVIEEKLTENLNKHVEKLEYEKAQDLQKITIFCKNFCKRQHFFRQFTKQNLIVSVTQNHQFSYKFKKGELIHPRLPFQTDYLLRSDDRFLSDRADIIYNWIHHKKNCCKFVFE